jgi:predicted nucleotidyltransferase
MLENLFTSKARVKLLEIFLFNKNTEFHTRDLARRLGISPPYVMKELYNLRSLGILQERKDGNRILYTINKSSTIVEELKRIFLKTEGVGSELLKTLGSKRTDIKYALIYGSFAKGTEVTSSDIDLLIIGKIDEDDILHSVMKLQNRLGREINYIVWTEKEFAEKVHQQIALLEEISKTSIIMIIGDTGEFKRAVKKATC